MNCLGHLNCCESKCRAYTTAGTILGRRELLNLRHRKPEGQCFDFQSGQEKLAPVKGGKGIPYRGSKRMRRDTAILHLSVRGNSLPATSPSIWPFLQISTLSHTCTFKVTTYTAGRSWWPRGLNHGSAASRLLGLRVRVPPGHGCLSLMNAVCCQVEVSASGWSLFQRSPAECFVSSYREASTMRRPWPTRDCHTLKKKTLQGRMLYMTDVTNFEVTQAWKLTYILPSNVPGIIFFFLWSLYQIYMWILVLHRLTGNSEL